MASERPLVFHPDALAELERAKTWYDGQRPGLGESLFQEITTAFPEYEKPRTPGRITGKEQGAFSYIGFPLQSFMINDQWGFSS